MSKSSDIVLALLVCMVVIAPHAEGITCDTVTKSLNPCRPAMKQGGEVTPSCCSGVKSLNSSANTTPARQSACECIKKLANSYKVKAPTINGVLKHCNVDVGFTVTNNLDCTKVH